MRIVFKAIEMFTHKSRLAACLCQTGQQFFPWQLEVSKSPTWWDGWLDSGKCTDCSTVSYIKQWNSLWREKIVVQVYCRVMSEKSKISPKLLPMLNEKICKYVFPNFQLVVDIFHNIFRPIHQFSYFRARRRSIHIPLHHFLHLLSQYPLNDKESDEYKS